MYVKDERSVLVFGVVKLALHCFFVNTSLHTQEIFILVIFFRWQPQELSLGVILGIDIFWWFFSREILKQG